MKSQRRHELQTNELADALGRFISRARPHGRLIAAAAGAVVILVVVLVALPMMRGRAADTTAAAFIAALRAGETAAMETFLDRFPESEQAPTARLLLADRLLAEAAVGRDAGDADPADAEKALAAAERHYTELAESSETHEPLARVGLALVALERGRLDDGRNGLEQVTERWPESLAAARARAHLEALAGYEPIAFSDEPLEEVPPADEGEPEAADGGAAEAPAPEPPAPEEAVPAAPTQAAPDGEEPKPAAEPARTPGSTPPPKG